MEVWHGAVTTLPPKLIVTSMLAKTEVRASVLCVQYFIVFNISTVMALHTPVTRLLVTYNTCYCTAQLFS